MIRYSRTVNNMITWLRMGPMHQQASNWTSSVGIFRFRLQKYWHSNFVYNFHNLHMIQYIPRNMHTVFALLCFVVVIHWLIFPYPSGLLHWQCGNLTIAPVPAKQPWWIWINTSCEFIMNDCITTTKQSTTKPCAYFLGYTVVPRWLRDVECLSWQQNLIRCQKTFVVAVLSVLAGLSWDYSCAFSVHYFFVDALHMVDMPDKNISRITFCVCV